MTTANKISLVSNRVERAKSYLLSQFKDRPNINAIVEALVEEIQEIENGIIEVQTARTLETSFGKWLDEIGYQARVARNGQKDNDYKTAIKIAQTKRNMSATKEDIEFVVALLTGDDGVKVNNPYPYMMELVSYLFCVAENRQALSDIADMFPVLTRVRLIQKSSKRFTFGTAGLGFGSGALLDNLVYVRQGAGLDEERFTRSATQVIPPPVTTKVYLISNPVAVGDNFVGSVLTTSNGVFGGDDPITYTYQWYSNGVAVSGATSTTFTIPVGSEGKVINCQVTASNSFSNASAFTNAINVATTTPPTVYFTTGGGMQDHYAVATSTGGSVTATAGIVFKSNGTIDYQENGVTATTTNYLTITGAGTGSGYRVSYQVLSGTALSGLTPNINHVLSSDITLFKAITSINDNVTTGQYRFTISKVSDPSIYVTKDIYITAEVLTSN